MRPMQVSFLLRIPMLMFIFLKISMLVFILLNIPMLNMLLENPLLIAIFTSCAPGWSGSACDCKVTQLKI